MMTQAQDRSILQRRLIELRGNPAVTPDASIVVPVNAQADLETVLPLLSDIASYKGAHRIEVVLVINNYPVDQPPTEIQAFTEMGVRVISIPNVRKPGQKVHLSARVPGIKAAASEHVILFDADCRIPDATGLLDWYIGRFQAGADLAYSHVAFHDVPRDWSAWAYIGLHHLGRYVKRVVLGVPTARGSNYGINRSLMLHINDQGYLEQDMNVGPVIKALGGRISYSAAKKLNVLTSGRYLRRGWKGLLRYYLCYRVPYNLHRLSARVRVAGEGAPDTSR